MVTALGNIADYPVAQLKLDSETFKILGAARIKPWAKSFDDLRTRGQLTDVIFFGNFSEDVCCKW